MRTLRVGLSGEDIESWQFFLRGLGLYLEEVDGIFGEGTKEATEVFQRHHALTDDGIVGNRTLGEAMRLGFSVLEHDVDAPDALDWPPKPSFSGLGGAGRKQVFGDFPFTPAPVAGNREAIQINASWVQEHIVVETIPQLSGIPGAPFNGRVQLHALAAKRVVELFARWEAENLIGLVLTFGGSFAPRFIRGSTQVLSSHAHGAAFDINVAWNGFGAMPALVHAKGSVRKLVPIANQLGFYWGGHFTKRDGMHFELAKL